MRYLPILLIAVASFMQGCKEDNTAACDCKLAQTVTYTHDPSIIIPKDTGTVSVGYSTIAYSGNSVQFNMRQGNWTSPLWAPATGLSCTDCLEPIATPTITTEYTLSVYDPVEMRSYTFGTLVEVIDESVIDSAFYIPNIFTPNGDGRNDLFQIMYSQYAMATHLVVKDGSTTVFETHNFNEGWDGRKNGNIPTGCSNYTYIADITFRNRTIAHVSGGITLLMAYDGSTCPDNAVDCRFPSQFDGSGFDPNYPSEVDDCF